MPVYNPAVVYGAWPYPAYPPVYLPPPPGYAVGTALLTGLAFGTGVAISAGLWGWARPNWGGGNVNVNVNRFNTINVNRPPINNSNWRPVGAVGQPSGGGFRPPMGPVGAPVRPGGLPANAIGRKSVTVPGNVVARPPGSPGSINRPGVGQGGASRPSLGQLPANRPAVTQQGARAPGAFNGINDGKNAEQFGNRGAQSRQSNPGALPGRSGTRAEGIGANRLVGGARR